MRTLLTAALSLLTVIAFGLAVPRPAAAESYTLTTLATFNGTNGAGPVGDLVRDNFGNLYGTTSGSGINQGTVFELAAGSSTITTLASFNGANGASPAAGLIRDAQGNLYGTTSNGGAFDDNGTVFKLAAGSSTITTLASFNGANGHSPRAGLIMDAQGNLYGTTSLAPTAPGQGTIFKIPAGSNMITTLASFNGANGAGPEAGLFRDAQGNLYGTTVVGGAFGSGTVFELAAGSSTITTLASFNGANGAGPEAGLVQDAQGNLFGTTFSGGAGDHGTIFELSPVPEPASLVLLGTGLLGSLGAWWLRRGQSQAAGGC